MSEKECDHCFEMVDDDVELCEECEQEERELDEMDDMDQDDLDDLEDEEDDFDEEDCEHCGFSFPSGELDDGLCGDCIADEEEDE